MKIIISPAKKMKIDADTLTWRDLPVFINRAETIRSQLRMMSYKELKQLWKCNDQIAALNVERLQQLDLQTNLTPAVLAYEGIQYRYMAPGVFSDCEYVYIQNHLRILSGFYGILRPFDGVIPYRLEMQAKLSINGARDLYAYWGSDIADNLFTQTDCIINLASKEYSNSVSRYLTGRTRFITCVFGEEQGNKVIEKGTLCKMARGEMVRYMAERNVTNPEEIKMFDRLNFAFVPAMSDENTFVFLLRKAPGHYD